MSIETAAISQLLKQCDLRALFNILGWDNFRTDLTLPIDGVSYQLHGLAEKRGVQVFQCASATDGQIPSRDIRARIETQLRKSAHEHLIIFTNAGAPPTEQVWQWVEREPDKPRAIREHTYYISQPGESLIQKLDGIRFDLDEEGELSLAGTVIPRVHESFGARDKVTKKFYERFQQEHGRFLGFIQDISEQGDREWYASVMLNRLMFIYFVQKKGFLDGDPHYLRNKLAAVRRDRGAGQFLSFYRTFLRRLFHEGLAHQTPRGDELEALLGNIPYLNGGIFDEHQLEVGHPSVDIADEAFEALFTFFDAYEWHLDVRPLQNDSEINPDVLGYIFEKYINQKQMGAYYTKEDITEYISANTVLPFVLQAAKNACRVDFEPDGAAWRLLQEDPDRYIHELVRKGVDVPLPPEIEAGIDEPAKRSAWNRTAASEFALPTETWREHLARRARYVEIRARLASGNVNEVEDLVTLNLDIQQFVRDVIDRSESADLVRAFYEATTRVSVLDPTCGSGAFLFAALNILRPLYEACLGRMDAFVEDEERLGRPLGGDHLFRQVLSRVALHPNREYFVLKSIIMDNLHGVDIMGEAVEICKLRLFLTLVAHVDDVAQIEPLPDIDFNIRSGNTLVGFPSIESVREAMAIDISGNHRLLFAEDEAALKRIEEGAELAGRAYDTFRRQQTEITTSGHLDDKQALRSRLEALNADLDEHLARQYGVDPANVVAYSEWRSNHVPFHWFVEFYGIMNRGGFDVIIGNPPYVEYSKVRSTYKVRGYATEASGNLYSYCVERASALLGIGSKIGFIVPLGGFATARMASYRDYLDANYSTLHISCFSGDANPSVLFDGVKYRLSIVLGSKGTGPAVVQSSPYLRWYAVERPVLFPAKLHYYKSPFKAGPLRFARLGSPQAAGCLSTLLSAKGTVGTLERRASKYQLNYHRSPVSWIRAIDFEPYFRSATRTRSDDHLKVLTLRDDDAVSFVGAVINSSLFYMWFISQGNCRDLAAPDVSNFPIGTVSPDGAAALRAVFAKLMRDYQLHSQRRVYNYQASGAVEYDEFYPRRSKSIIDDIDRLLADHYGFTAEELDFVLNYDIKYRMGADAADELRASAR